MRDVTIVVEQGAGPPPLCSTCQEPAVVSVNGSHGCDDHVEQAFYDGYKAKIAADELTKLWDGPGYFGEGER